MRELIRFSLFVFCRARCFVRRRHAAPAYRGRAPVRARGRGRRSVEYATKTVCSECGKSMGVTANRAWRRAAGFRR